MIIALALAASTAAARAAPCAFESLGDGHVAEVIDGKSFRLSDGREIRLAGIEPALPDAKENAKENVTENVREVAKKSVNTDRAASLSAIIADKDVTLRGEDDAPDRYGRQHAFVFLAPAGTLVQGLLLSQGAAVASADVTDKACADALMAAEAEARTAKRGTWAGTSVIKNAESPDDILTGIGRFVLVEGKVLSVRQAGAITYLNFGRSWTRDFAATISRRNMPAVESTGVTLKSLENRRIRVRGWVEGHPGPRIEVMRAGQIEVLGGH